MLRDRETIARAGDHRALRVWLRLLTCTQLIERRDEPADRRAFRIRLTRAGERTFADMARAHEEWVVELFSGMSRRDQDELLKLLAKVKQHAVEREA